jgi:hypothetical protein
VRGLLEAATAVGLFCAISLAAASGQGAERIFADARQYLVMSWQFADGQSRVTADAPFVYRPATPWLAATVKPLVAPFVSPGVARAIEDASGLKGVEPFYAVNIGAAFAAMCLLLAYLRCFVHAPWVRLVVIAAWLAAWHAPARYVYFNPVNVEPLFLAAVVAGLLAVEKTREMNVLAAALAVTPLVVLATMCRESGVLIAAVFLSSRPLLKLPGTQRLAACLPALAAILALVLVRQLGTSARPYQPWTEPLEMLRTKPLWGWVLAWFFTFGPSVIALIASATGAVRQLFAARPELPVYLFLVGLLGFFGGTDTERILGWAAPVMMVVLGCALTATGPVLRRAPLVIGVLVVAQLASARLLWPVPVGMDQATRAAELGLDWASVVALMDKALVIDNYYANLWTYFGSRSVHGAILVFDVLFVIAVVAVMRRSSRPLPVLRAAGAGRS